MAELVQNLNARKNHFMLYNDEKSAVNLDFMKNLEIERIFESDSTAILAELSDEETAVILKEFDCGDEEKDFQAAQDYFAELVKFLNG